MVQTKKYKKTKTKKHKKNKNKKTNIRNKLDITDVPISSTVSLGTLASIGDIGYHYQAYDNIYEFFTILKKSNNS